MVVVDLGGGVMAVVRGDESQIDALVVVVEPYPRSADVGRRLLETAEANGITRCIVVANKIGDAEDLEALHRFLGVEPDLVIPQDRSVQVADRVGTSPFDHDPGSPAVDVLRELATALVP